MTNKTHYLVDPWDFASFVINHYNKVYPAYKKYIRKYTLNYDANEQAIKYCQLLLEEKIKEDAEREAKDNFPYREVLDKILAEEDEKEKKKAIDFLIHGDPGKRPKKVVTPDYLQVIEGGQL